MTWFKKAKKEPLKLPKNRECPSCKKTIDAEANKCPYCQSKVIPISLSMGFKGWINRHPVLTIVITIIAFIIIINIFSGVGSTPNISPSTTSNNTGGNTENDFATQLSNQTGRSRSDILGALNVVKNYNFDDNMQRAIVTNAAYVTAIKYSSGKDSAQVKYLGFGDLIDTADTFSKILRSWKVTSAEVPHDLDVLFNSALASTIKWPDFSNALIRNGSIMNKYTDFIHSVTALAALSKQAGDSASIELFNRIGDALADPQDKININLGGPGYIRNVVKKDGILKAMELIISALKSGG